MKNISTQQVYIARQTVGTLRKVILTVMLGIFFLSCKDKSVDAGGDPIIPPLSVVLPADIDSDRILKDLIDDPQLPDYLVNGDIEISARLTIEPGVVIAMARDARIAITGSKGALIAVGTEEKNICFVGQQPLRGYWSGIVNSSQSTANIMAFTQIRHSGSKTVLDNQKMALALVKESHFSVENSLFAENEGYGLFIQEGASINGFFKNIFKDNGQAGILLPTELVEKLDTLSSFRGSNGRDVVEVSGPFIGETGSKSEVQWSGFADKTPYRLLKSVAVRTGWRLAPGVTIEVSRGESIIVNENAYLIAVGTQGENITFTGADDEAGSWKGILLHSTSNRNVLHYAQLLNGGSDPIIDGENANLALYGEGAYINIRNCAVKGSGGYGIYVGYGSSINENFETTTTFSGNKNGDYLSHNGITKGQ